MRRTNEINKKVRIYIKNNPEKKCKWNRTYFEKFNACCARQTAYDALSFQQKQKYDATTVCHVCNRPFDLRSTSVLRRRDIYNAEAVHTACIA